MISGDAGPFTDPDGFAWEAASLEPDAAAQLHHSTACNPGARGHR